MKSRIGDEVVVFVDSANPQKTEHGILKQDDHEVVILLNNGQVLRNPSEHWHFTN